MRERGRHVRRHHWAVQCGTTAARWHALQHRLLPGRRVHRWGGGCAALLPVQRAQHWGSPATNALTHDDLAGHPIKRRSVRWYHMRRSWGMRDRGGRVFTCHRAVRWPTQARRHGLQHRHLPGWRVQRWGGTRLCHAVACTGRAGSITTATATLTHANPSPTPTNQTHASTSHALHPGNARAPPARATPPLGCAARRHCSPTARPAAPAPARPACAQVGSGALLTVRYKQLWAAHATTTPTHANQKPSIPIVQSNHHAI
jgi:hypothetical protein